MAEGREKTDCDGERIETGSAYDLTSFSMEKSETSMEKSERMASLQFSRLREMIERLQESINGIEKSMDFHCVTVRELQAVITSQNATMLGLEASVHALKASRPSVPHFTDFTDKVLSATLRCPDADFHMETPAGSRKCSVDRLDTPLSLASPGHSHGPGVYSRSPGHSHGLGVYSRSPGVTKRTRITDSMDCENFVERHGRMHDNVRELEDVKAVSLRRQNNKPVGKTRSKSSKPTPPTSEALGSSMKPPAGTPQTLRLAPAPSPVSATVSKAKLTTYKSQSVSDMPSMVGKGQMSMEALRQTYDAVVIGTTTSPACPTDEENLKLGQSAFPCLGRFLLCLVGHLQFGTGLPSWLFSFFSFAVLPISLTGLLVCATVVISGASTNWSMTMVLTLSFFQLGVSFASVSFKLNDMDLLLGPAENQLDDYAEGRGFMIDWQRLSRRRLVETVCVFVCMMIGRALVNLSFGQRFGGFGDRLVAEQGFDVAVFSWCMWLMIIRFLLLCYSFLHVSCGLELALDSFTLRFFNELDIEEALEEWNVLQAALRQVSSKMSSSLLAIGFCALAGLAILAEHVIFRTNGDMEIVANWLLRFYPLILFFLYSIMRVAEVTEKASRVAPLVNSWQFDHDDGSLTGWMDPGRQYAVQYINQSRAGFYLRGTQLTMPTAQRISYYLAALSVALLSRLFT